MLYKFPSGLKNHPGVYIISQFSSPDVKTTSRVKVKIGLAKGSLYDRLDSYHTSLIDSFYIYSVIQTRNAQDAVDLEKTIHRRLKAYHYKNAVYDARPRGGEFFLVRKSMLKNVVDDIIREKFDYIRGLLNYNDSFKLTLPNDLGNFPKRKLYPTIKDVEKAGDKPIVRKPRMKRKTFDIVAKDSVIAKKDITAKPANVKRKRVPNKKYT